MDTDIVILGNQAHWFANLVLLSRRAIISRRKVHKHGSDMMPYVLLTRFLITITF